MSSFDSFADQLPAEQPRWEVRTCTSSKGNSHYYVSPPTCFVLLTQFDRKYGLGL